MTRQQAAARLSFVTDQWVPRPPHQVFAFFSDPENLPRLMPSWQCARIDSMELQNPELQTPELQRQELQPPQPEAAFAASQSPRAAGRGSRILLSFRPVPLLPVRLRWLALIDDYVADHRFCDLQVTGPFGYWRHCHQVVAETHRGVSGTRITDVVDYAWPGGRLSPLIDLLGGRLQIALIFRHRQRQVANLLAAMPDPREP